LSAAVVLAEWARNAWESVRVSLAEFNGQPVVDLRIWFDDGGGATKPGRQGLTLGARHLPRLADALAKAVGEAQARGLLNDG
jgi:hypothetical protein